MCHSLLLLLCALWAGPLLAEEPATQELSLADLLNDVRITVASKKAMPSRESPGIVTVITAEEIRAMGARDLIDVLEHVPGFMVSGDVQGILGLSVRGNWANEGKVLLIWDGLEQNELAYNTFLLGGHYPVDQIKQIEIIRGPGSAIYGGTAELAVIKVVSFSGRDLAGGEVGLAGGSYRAGRPRTGVNVQAGGATEQFEGRLAHFSGFMNRSSYEYRDLHGQTYDQTDIDDRYNKFTSGLLRYEGLEVNVIQDVYQMQIRENFSYNLPTALGVDFIGRHALVKYQSPPIAGVVLTPFISHFVNNPYRSADERAKSLRDFHETRTRADGTPYEVYPYSYVYGDREYTRQRIGVTASYDPSDSISIVAGHEAQSDHGQDMTRENFRATDSTAIKYENKASYAQGILVTPVGSVTVGGRFEEHSQYGKSLVKRLGLTKVIDQFHFKLLASGAFKAPSIMNIDLAPEIKPELTRTFEFETGYVVTSDLFVTLNAFDTVIERPIVYVLGNGGKYINSDRTGTRGLEIEARYKKRASFATANYSYYTGRPNNHSDQYVVPGDAAALLGVPQHRVTSNLSYGLNEHLSINPSAIYLHTRHGYVHDPDASELERDRDEHEGRLHTFGPVALVDVNVRYRDLGIQGLDLMAGVYNVTNVSYDYVQSYGGRHAPARGKEREIATRIGYAKHF